LLMQQILSLPHAFWRKSSLTCLREIPGLDFSTVGDIQVRTYLYMVHEGEMFH
jgi:hypothetical protein